MSSKEYFQEYRKKHRDKLNENHRNWYNKHKKEIKIWRQNNKEILKIRGKSWRDRNKKKKRKDSHEYYMKNKERYRKWNQYKRRKDVIKIWRDKYYKVNIQARLNRNFGHKIRDALKEQKAGRHWEELVDYTLNDLLKHLESQFDKNMSWDNYGPYWWVDHIKPKSLFKFNSFEDKEFKDCWALSNLQPMEKIANIKKSNHYD